MCGAMKKANTTLHRFPADPAPRKKWLDNLKLQEQDITSNSRVCSLHFRDGNTKTIPLSTLGRRLTERPDYETPRSKRLASRLSFDENRPSKRTHASPSLSSPEPQATPEPLIVSPSESLCASSIMEGSGVSAGRGRIRACSGNCKCRFG